MSERDEPSLEDGIRTARILIRRPAPMYGLIDLPAFDETAGQRSMEARRQAVYDRLGTTIPLNPDTEEVERTARRKKLMWIASGISAILFILTVSLPDSGIGSFAALAWLISLVAIWILWRAGRPQDKRPVSMLPDLAIDEEELRLVWVARQQVAAIMRTRAWNSEDVRGSVPVVDLGETLARLTTRSMDLYRFIATASPEPKGAQPAVVDQWRRERDRVRRAREESVEQLAALVVYREEFERVSSLLDQRDQMAELAERATEFDRIASDHRSPGSDPSGMHGDLEHNLKAQIGFLGEMADRSSTAGALSDAIHRP